MSALFLLCLLSFVSTTAYAIELNGIFSDHMVLQRNQPIKIYGRGKVGEIIKVQLDTITQKTKVAKNGLWQVELSERKASSTPITLKVSNSSKVITVKDILIGDIWVCSGQSNMGWQVKATQPLPKNYSYSGKLRLLTSKLIISPEIQQDNFTSDPVISPSGWARATQKNVLNTSAIAYYMGLELVKQTDVPVGIIVAALGGSQIWPWMTPESIDGHPHEKMAQDSAIKAQKWAVNHAKVLRKKGQNYKADQLLKNYQAKSPSALYNGMLHPLTNFPIKGMLWYQGERSQDNPLPYRELFPSAIQGWRKAWKQGDFPFVFIQLPAYFGEKREEKRARGFSLVREAQELALKLPNTGMAMALEFGHRTDVHPQEKSEVGRRAALQALRLTGHYIVADGPVKKSITIDGKKAKIIFINVAERLITKTVKIPRTKGKISSNDPNPYIAPKTQLIGFEVCGTDKVFRPAIARIIGQNTVELSSEEVDKIIHIRYAFHQFPLSNLYNSEGLPTRPFRTDNYDVAYGK